MAADADEESADSEWFIYIYRNILSRSRKEGALSSLRCLSCRSWSKVDAQDGSVCLTLSIKKLRITPDLTSACFIAAVSA